MNILVTGAAGFVGRNLVENLKNIRDGKNRTRPNLTIDEIYEYDLGNTQDQLDEWCAKADFVFNLAGVNRPKDPAEFQAGNYGFASTLLETLKDCGNTCPVMLAMADLWLTMTISPSDSRRQFRKAASCYPCNYFKKLCIFLLQDLLRIKALIPYIHHPVRYIRNKFQRRWKRFLWSAGNKQRINILGFSEFNKCRYFTVNPFRTWRVSRADDYKTFRVRQCLLYRVGQDPAYCKFFGIPEDSLNILTAFFHYLFRELIALQSVESIAGNGLIKRFMAVADENIVFFRISFLHYGWKDSV